MRYVEAGGARMSAVGLGTWQFGSAEWGYGPDYAASTAGLIVRRALDLGVNLIDTAEFYGFGRSERIVGVAVGGRRGEAFLATKLFPVVPFPPIIRIRARGSARRLGVSRIDLYQIHWRNPLVPIATQMAGLRPLLDEGRILHAGVSNFDLRRWQAAEAALGRPVLTDQVRFNLLQRDPLAELTGYAARFDRVVIAYSPLGQGSLSGRYGPGRPPPGMVRRRSPVFRDLARVEAIGRELAEVGRPYGATPSQVALAWLLRHPHVVPIPGASSVAQLEENVAAADLDLTEDEAARLEAAAAAFPTGGEGSSRSAGPA